MNSRRRNDPRSCLAQNWRSRRARSRRRLRRMRRVVEHVTAPKRTAGRPQTRQNQWNDNCSPTAPVATVPSRPSRGQQRFKSKNYFGPVTDSTNVSLSGPTNRDGVGVAGDFGRGSEIFWRTSCSAACSYTSGEGATTAVGAIMPEACASGAGASQRNCSDQFAIVSLAASPYDCQPDVAATPRQNAITKRKMVRPSDGGLLDTRAFSRSC
jgi:hypothetical protein